MAENFISRIIFQDDFTATTNKFKNAADDVVDSSKKAGNEVEKTSSSIGKLKSALSSITGTHKTRVRGVGLETVEDNISSIQRKIEKLTGQPVTITGTAKVTHSDITLAKAEAKELKRQLKELTGKNYDINMSVGGTSVLGGAGKGALLSTIGGGLVAGGVGAAVMGATAAVGAGVKTMWTGANERQQYLSSMTHFMGNEQDAQAMMDWANDNSRTTQFSSGEVLAAASRAIQVSEGDATEAKRLTTLAEDMASLTPGKTVGDALEALADANMGEMERMKEFGFKGSAEDFKNAGGDLFAMKGANGKTIEEMFAGGTAAGAQNASAKIGTITGNFEDALASAGEKLLNGLNPALDWLVEASGQAADMLGNALNSAGSWLGTTLTNVRAALEPYMPLLSTLGQIVGTVVTTAFSLVGDVINNLVLPALKWIGETVVPVFQPLIDNVGTVTGYVKSFGKALSSVIDTIGNMASQAASKISSIGSSIWSKISGADRHATGAMAYGGLTQINENMKGELIRLPNGSRIYPYETTRRLLGNEMKKANTGGMSNVFNINVDARGSNMTNEQIYRLKKSLVNDIVAAFDNVAPA